MTKISLIVSLSDLANGICIDKYWGSIIIKYPFYIFVLSIVTCTIIIIVIAYLYFCNTSGILCLKKDEINKECKMLKKKPNVDRKK